MAKLGRRRVVKMSLEETPGEPVAGAVDLLCYDPQCNPDDATIQREPSGASGGQAKAERGPMLGKMTFRAELRSNGAAALDAGLLVCFQGCGMKLSGSVLAPVTAIAQQKALTIEMYKDGLKERLYGAMGTWEMTGEFGKQVFVNFTFSGLYANLGNAAVPGVEHTAAPPLRFAGVTLSVGQYTPKVSRFSVNPHNPVEAREDAAAANGEAVAHFLIGPGRRYVIGLDPEAVAADTWDPRALWADKAERTFSLALADATAQVTIAAPKVQHAAPQEGAREAKAIHEVSLQCNADAGDDELTITAAGV